MPIHAAVDDWLTIDPPRTSSGPFGLPIGRMTDRVQCSAPIRFTDMNVLRYS